MLLHYILKSYWALKRAFVLSRLIYVNVLSYYYPHKQETRLKRSHRAHSIIYFDLPRRPSHFPVAKNMEVQMKHTLTCWLTCTMRRQEKKKAIWALNMHVHDLYTIFFLQPRSTIHHVDLLVYACSDSALHLPSLVTNRYPLSPSWSAILAATTIKCPKIPWCSSVAYMMEGASGLAWWFKI